MLSSLSSVPPVWPSPRPDIFGTTTPQAAARGASTIETLSPTPPVLCLPTLMPGMGSRSTRSPDRDHGVGQPGRFHGVHALEHDRHQQRRYLIVGPRTVGHAADKASMASRDSASPSRFARMMSTARMGGRQYIVGSDRMAQRAAQPADISRNAENLARAITIGLRTWGFYPPEHPAVGLAVDKLVAVATEATNGGSAARGHAAGPAGRRIGDREQRPVGQRVRGAAARSRHPPDHAGGGA